VRTKSHYVWLSISAGLADGISVDQVLANKLFTGKTIDLEQLRHAGYQIW